MNNAFTKHFKAFAAVLTAAVMSLSASVFADTAEKAELKASEDRADVILTLPQAAAEGVSSVQVSLNVSVNTDNAEITFVPNEKLGAKIQESRYHKDTGVLNIYTVGTTPLFDKADPTINLGYVVISSNAANGAAANVAFVKGSLKYVRGNSLETYDNGLNYSNTVKILVGKGGEEEPPIITDPPVITEDETPEPTQAPVDTAEPPVVIPPSDGDDQPQPIDLSELKSVLATAESYRAEDYTEESFKVLQAAIANAKEVINSANPTAEQIEEARMLLENAIGMLVKKAEHPAGDVTASASNGEGSSSQNGEGNTSANGEGSSPDDDNNAVTAGNNNDDDSSKNPANGDPTGAKDGINPLIVILIVVGVVVVGLGAAIVVTLNKNKSGKHSK
ncbi:MAG: hypothetical protein K2J79_02010 [Ruminiclostridium sp.]|nr:hypothetical protein [Ruminiclostridium sp.]